MSYHLPMIECSSCGKIIGHLYHDYYELSLKTSRILKSLTDKEDDLSTVYKALADQIDGNSDFKYGDGNSLSEYLSTYYEWLSENLEHDYFTPHNIVARGLLRLRDLKPEHLPINKLAEDNQRNHFEASTCCLRMLHSDPSTQIV